MRRPHSHTVLVTSSPPRWLITIASSLRTAALPRVKVGRPFLATSRTARRMCRTSSSVLRALRLARRLSSMVTLSAASVRFMSLEQRLGLDHLPAVLVAEAIRGLVHRHAGVLSLRVQRVEVQTEVRPPFRVQQPLLDRVLRDALERGQRGVLRVGAAAHLLDDHERTEVEEIRLAAAGRSRRAD